MDRIMGKVSRFSGSGCRFNIKGACIYGESMNPGLEAGWRCAVLSRWEDAYDDYISRADNMGLSPENAAAIWKDRFERMVRDEWGCCDYHYDGSGDLPGCVHLYEGLCLRALPTCEGVCSNYQSRRKA